MKITWINKWVSVFLAFFSGMHFGEWVLSGENGSVFPLLISIMLFSCACINQVTLLSMTRIRDYYDRRIEK